MVRERLRESGQCLESLQDGQYERDWLQVGENVGDRKIDRRRKRM